MKVIYLIDFDGTITRLDTLEHIARKFFPDRYKEWGRKLMNNEYSIRDWLTAFEEHFNIHKSDYDKILEEIEIDESFLEFMKTRECAVLSGGFIYNIRTILNRYIDSKDIKIYANDLHFIGENRAKIDKTYSNGDCLKCGVCKTSILMEYRKNYDKIIFIGDGITDICAAQESDEIYAKRGLYLDKYLTENRVEHFVFDSFSDIK